MSGGSEPTRGILSWLRERLGWEALARIASKKEVPLHRWTLFYYLGGMALFLFTVQVATGILLLLYYRPSSSEAFESVQYIMAEVPFGWLIRSIHSWGANLFVGVVLLHMISVFFLKAYRAPRELTWMSGALLLFLALGFGFSGYLLPWNELSFFATRVGTDVPAQIPVIGSLSRGSCAEDPTSRAPRSPASTAFTSRSCRRSRPVCSCSTSCSSRNRA